MCRSEMHIKYTDHALWRIKRRRISETNIKDTIKNPDLMLKTCLRRFVASKRYGDKFLKVVYEKNNTIVVVTVYWTRRI